MNKTHEFYPMLTGTMKNIILAAQEQYPDANEGVLRLLLCYPDTSFINNDFYNPLLKMAIAELDRQYSRWSSYNKKGE